jgi:hypothetical protein
MPNTTASRQERLVGAGTPPRLKSWVALTFYSLTAGIVSVGAAAFVGSAASYAAGRRTILGAALQIAAMSAIVVMSGCLADGIINRLRRDWAVLFRRRRS